MSAAADPTALRASVPADATAVRPPEFALRRMAIVRTQAYRDYGLHVDLAAVPCPIGGMLYLLIIAAGLFAEFVREHQSSCRH